MFETSDKKSENPLSVKQSTFLKSLRSFFGDLNIKPEEFRNFINENRDYLKLLKTPFTISLKGNPFMLSNFEQTLHVTQTTSFLIIGQDELFDILVDAYPKILFLSNTSITHSTLKCAIAKGELGAVLKILGNQHFVKHEVDNPKEHLLHIQECLDYAELQYSACIIAKEEGKGKDNIDLEKHMLIQTEIVSVLRAICDIKLPINAEIRANNCINIMKILESSSCKEFGKVYKEECRIMFRDCIKLAEEYQREEITKILHNFTQ